MARTIELSDVGKKRTKKSVISTSKKKKKSSKEEVSEIKKPKKKKSTKVSSEKSKTKKSKKSKSGTSLVERQERAKDKADALEGTLQNLIAENPSIKEHDQFQEYVDIFEKLQKIARIKEEQCVKNNAQSKDVYALMQIYNQMRDVIADIRAMRDITQVADEVSSEILEPFAQQSASILMEFYQNVEQLARKTLGNDEVLPFLNHLKAYAVASGTSMQEALRNSNDKIVEVLADQ